MQKWLLATWLLLIGITIASAQDKLKIVSAAKFFGDFTIRDINAEKIVKPSFSFATWQVQVIDNRYDTLHVGSINKHYKADLWLTFTNNQSLSQVIGNKLLQKKENPLLLLVVIKDFWFTESKDLNTYGQKKTLSEVDNNLVCKLEFYQKLDNNKAVAITRVDTTLTAKNDNARYSAMNIELINSILQISVDKIDKAIHAASYANRKPIAIEDIYASINERFEKPILKDEVLRKGVYKTKENFLNNAPSDTNFTVKQDTKRFIALYLKDEDGNEYLSRDSWGYCDGATIFINNKGMFNPLYRIGNAFFWRAFNMVKIEPFSFSTPNLVNGNSTTLERSNFYGNIQYNSYILYLLNLDKGTHY
ncbi:MAG: hypothetical protein QM541_11575 [Flavobacterium sp.]|nr:hypothetical protein [Flavobacterium sp.]